MTRVAWCTAWMCQSATITLTILLPTTRICLISASFVTETPRRPLTSAGRHFKATSMDALWCWTTRTVCFWEMKSCHSSWRHALDSLWNADSYCYVMTMLSTCNSRMYSCKRPAGGYTTLRIIPFIQFLNFECLFEHRCSIASYECM